MAEPYNIVPTNTVDAIEKISAMQKSEETKKGYLSALFNAVRGNPELERPYQDKIKEFRKELSKQAKKQIITTQEKEKYIPWDTVLKTVPKIKDNSAISESDKLLLDFYTLTPPKRADYTHVHIFYRKPRKDIGNYIVLRQAKPYMKINDHKTSGTYGGIETPIPSELYKSITSYLENHPDTKTLWEFSESVLSERIIAMFMKAIGKRVGISILRHAFISNFLKTAPTLLQKEHIARHMGHSVSEQDIYRRTDE
jgi:hypothetical protein